ncbi:MAG: hypothetical protein H7235_06790 [Bdellovibrionaceae bacterium]|nr:hypothetical protein [Pseudobdellovibrionaceae bacterium]
MKKLIFMFIFLPLACSQNLLQDTSSLSPDENYYGKAMDALNDESYDAAIAIVNTQITPTGQTVPKVRELLASAYAGKCGLNFLNYIKKLTEQTSGSAMSNLMMPFVQVAVDPASCRVALQTMELIGPTASRNNNQNIFTSVTGMVLIGTALRGYADLSPALGDGVVDINLCTGFTDAQVDNIIIGFGFFNKNFSAITSAMIGSHSSFALGDVVTMCNNTAGSGACQITNPADITPIMRSTFRDLVNTKEYGIGAYTTGGDPTKVPMSCP